MWQFNKQPSHEQQSLSLRYHRAMASGRFKEAEDVFREMVALDERPCRAPLPQLIRDWIYHADGFLDQGEWGKAESTYRAILAVQSIDAEAVWAAHSNLCRLFGLLNQTADAMDQARLAAIAARQTGSVIVIAKSLQSEAMCFMEQGALVQASDRIEEALSTLHEYPAGDLERASVLIVRAQCALLLGRLEGADADLKRTLAVLERALHRYPSTVAHWWSATAQLNERRADAEGAISAWRHAVRFSHLACCAPTGDVYCRATWAVMLSGLRRSLLAQNRTEEAQSAQKDRDGIERALHLPPGVTLREPPWAKAGSQG